ncbi:hypothetical protein DRE_04261 [Drechslerella stenobrocha 248]|uniref:Uncharacterized protein n=1 Tax=Drechslerella stenobrocha 248 TaxID=1043628 RepID=W7I313_9PEZI|nr:hypothetical protein DRE_04261 [Drechslerella stenobrocha 248]
MATSNNSPTYRVRITLKNTTHWPLTMAGQKTQSGAKWETYLPQVIDERSEGSWSEIMGTITDDAEGFAEYSLCDGDNILDIKISWLSPSADGERKAVFKSAMEGDEQRKYQIKNTSDANPHSNVTFTISKK